LHAVLLGGDLLITGRACPLPAVYVVIPCRRHVTVASLDLLRGVLRPPLDPAIVPRADANLGRVADRLLHPHHESGASLGGGDGIFPALGVAGLPA